MPRTDHAWQRVAQAVRDAFDVEGVTTSPPSSIEEWQWLAESVADQLLGYADVRDSVVYPDLDAVPPAPVGRPGAAAGTVRRHRTTAGQPAAEGRRDR